MKLVVYKHGERIQELSLSPGNSYLVGRKDSCDIPLEKLPGISREHLKIEGDDSGSWNIEVLSTVKLIHYKGEDHQELEFFENTKFSLSPYEFEFIFEDTVGSHAKPSQALDSLQQHQVDDDNDMDDSHLNKTFVGNEEKTSIQSFEGIPYIKFLGKNGKKSEFFRLEGNLWVAGGDDNASIFLSDTSAIQNHFEISKTDKGYFISDSGSPLGTVVNGQKISPKTPLRIFSGDIIVVGSQDLIFELRDQSFKHKVNNIPLHMYENPLVFFDNEVAMVSTEPQQEENGRAEEVQMEKETKFTKKNKIRIAFVASIVLIFAGLSFSGNNDSSDKITANQSLDPFLKLDSEQKKLVVRTYNLSKNLYLNANFELALVQLQKLHSILPNYKDSREMEEYCVNSRELKRQQALIEQQKKEQEAIKEQVHSILGQCHHQFKKSYDIDGATACLSPAVSMDPNNPQISEILGNITARIEERKVRMKAQQEQADRIRRGQELYTKAKALHNKKNLLKAIEAYENHIHSGLPDPKNLVVQSKRRLSSIENLINAKKSGLVQLAHSRYKGTQLKEAIELARKAQRVDPFDHTISNFINKAEKELSGKMKNIYLDSMIEESFGNLEASRTKWEEIIRLDVKGGNYHKKAKRKMKLYGF